MARPTVTQTLTNEVPTKLRRKTPDQKKAFDAYIRAEKAEDRYLGSVFADVHGSAQQELKVKAAYDACKKLGMTHEHGL